MDLLLALSPIILLIVFILVFKRSVVFSAFIALLAVIFVTIFRGGDYITIIAAMTRGVFVATEIIMIVFGAIVMLYIVRARGLLDHLQALFMKLSTDYRVHVLLVSFGIVYFIEGVAGFGTPAIIAVPLFMALGFKPLWSVALALIADSIPVNFGAIGLPVIFGVGSVVEPLSAQPENITSQTSVYIAAINIALTALLSLVLVATSVRQRGGSLRHFTEFVPFAILSSLTVSIPAFIVAYYVGPELPSVIGGLSGLVVIGYLAHRRLGVPKSSYDHKIQSEPVESEQKAIAREDSALLKALSPYILLVLLLLITRLPYLPLGDWLKGLSVGSSSLLGTSIAYSIAPFYSAAAILLLCALFAILIFRKYVDPKEIISHAVRAVFRPFIALLFVLMFVQVFIYSETSNLESLPVLIAQALSDSSGIFWPFVAPFVGALGAFVAGSATVSNLIFSGLQYDIALSSQFNASLMLSLQAIGASLGNVVALHNVVAALTIAGLSERYSHRVISNNLVPMLIMLSALGVFGLVAVVTML